MWEGVAPNMNCPLRVHLGLVVVNIGALRWFYRMQVHYQTIGKLVSVKGHTKYIPGQASTIRFQTSSDCQVPSGILSLLEEQRISDHYR